MTALEQIMVLLNFDTIDVVQMRRDATGMARVEIGGRLLKPAVGIAKGFEEATHMALEGWHRRLQSAKTAEVLPGTPAPEPEPED